MYIYTSYNIYPVLLRSTFKYLTVVFNIKVKKIAIQTSLALVFLVISNLVIICIEIYCVYFLVSILKRPTKKNVNKYIVHKLILENGSLHLLRTAPCNPSWSQQ